MLDLSAHEAAAIVEWAEAEAWWQLCRAVPAELAAELGLTVERWDELTVSTNLRSDTPLSNRALGLGVLVPAVDATVAALVGHYRSLGLKNYAIQLPPLVQWELEPSLARHGLVSRGRWAKLLRDSRPVAEEGETPYTVRRIDADQAQAFGLTAAAGFGRPALVAPFMASTVGHPDWYHYLAYDGDRPVAAGAVFVQGEVAWLGIGATLPEYRQRGAQSALLARRIRDAVELGARWLTAETPEDLPEAPNPSYRNMLRLGFELVYQRDNFGDPLAA